MIKKKIYIYISINNKKENLKKFYNIKIVNFYFTCINIKRPILEY